MLQKVVSPTTSQSVEELSGYREVLSVIRKRFELYGITDAAEYLEIIDLAVAQAILDRLSQPRRMEISDANALAQCGRAN